MQKKVQKFAEAVRSWSVGKLLDGLYQNTREELETEVKLPEVDDVLRGYMHDFVHTFYSPGSKEEEEVGTVFSVYHGMDVAATFM